MSDRDIIAREIWTYNECPWDFDNPPEGMARLQKQIALDQAAAILTALRDNGRVIVPREPTTRMMIEMNEPYVPDDWDKYCRRYRAMIAAGDTSE